MPFADIPPQPPMTVAVPVVLRLTAERVQVSDGATMGLAGLHYLRPLGTGVDGTALDGTGADGAGGGYGGLSVFGALQGDRGGFFGWGVSAGYRWQHGPWSAEAGGFVGGGGGSPGWVGGGLMLRPHAAVAYQWGPLSLGLGASQVWFPNGAVRSTQPFASLSWAGSALFGPAGGADAPPVTAWQAAALPTETAAVAGQYGFGGRSVRRDGSGAAPAMRYGGLVVRRALPGSVAGGQPYWLISTAGALSPAYAGYAELLGGLGAWWPAPAGLPWSLRLEAGVGSAGAGTAADTGGGLLARVAGGVSWQLGPNLGLTASAGRVASPGPFKARDARIELAWRGWDFVPGAQPSPGPAPGAVAWVPWSVSAGSVQFARMRRDGGRDPGLGLAALTLERALGPHWHVRVQANIATHGAAGGYATGQIGLGWRSAPLAGSPWQLGADASVGAAGGGSVRVGGGLIGQAQLQARYALSPHWALQADAGWLRSRHGVLSSPLVGLSAVYLFSRLQGI